MLPDQMVLHLNFEAELESSSREFCSLRAETCFRISRFHELWDWPLTSAGFADKFVSKALKSRGKDGKDGLP